MTVSLWVKTIVFSGADDVELTEGSIAVIVGPNNSGKTSTLRELLSALETDTHGPVVSSVVFGKIGDKTDVTNWLDRKVARCQNKNWGTEVYAWLGHECAVVDFSIHKGAATYWNAKILGPLAQMLCAYLPVDERLAQIAQRRESSLVESFNLLIDAPHTPIQVLVKDETIENSISESFRRAFGVDLILNRGSGTDFPLHCGDRPNMEPDEDRVSLGYVSRLAKLPMLNGQGHGDAEFCWLSDGNPYITSTHSTNRRAGSVPSPTAGTTHRKAHRLRQTTRAPTDRRNA